MKAPADYTGVLVCPCCGGALSVTADVRSFICAAGHCYDISKYGTANFAGGGYRSGSGDSAEMVRARSEFLSGGWFSPLSEKLFSLAAERGGVCVDCGCGEGHHTLALARAASLALGFDLSKSAVTAAAKAAKRQGTGNAFFAVSSLFSLPLAPGSVDFAVSVFAPAAEKEMKRILRPSGVFVVAAAGREHLKEMKEILYDTVRENEERSDLPVGMKEIKRENISYSASLDNVALRALYLMTPYSRKSSTVSRDRLYSLERLDVTFSFDIHVYEADR